MAPVNKHVYAMGRKNMQLFDIHMDRMSPVRLESESVSPLSLS
jgi:hypothetical protein